MSAPTPTESDPQPLSCDTRNWLKSELARELAGGVALHTTTGNGESTVEVYFPTDAQVRKAQALCEGYFGMGLVMITGCLHPSQEQLGNTAASIAEKSETSPAVCFRFSDTNGIHAGTDFLKEFKSCLPVVHCDVSTLEEVPQTPGWRPTRENYKALGPGWEAYGNAHEKVESLLRVQGKVNGFV